MKAQCDRCKEIVPLEFTQAERGIEVTCPACHATYFVAARVLPVSDPPATNAPPVRAGSTPGMTCPKCGENQPAAAACRKCGLVVEKWRGQLAAADASTPSLEDAREAAALWAEVEAHWDDPARHDAFLNFCQKTTSYAFAATRYRAAQDAHPDAAQRLKQVRTLAEFALKRPAVARKERSPYKATAILLTAIFVVLVAGATYMLFLRGAAKKRQQGPDTPVPTLR